MLPANLVSSLQVLAKPVKPLIVADNTPQKTATQTETVNKLEVGQQVQATIQEQISPGLFRVQVAGQSMQMQLPGSPKVGNILTLKVETASPRLTFSFLASTAPIATAEQISSTSRLLSNLAELPLGRTLIESAAGHAVWQATNTPPDSKQLATGLKDALANSGLFYESHQAQWISGERTIAQLLIEPQNQLNRNEPQNQLNRNEPQNQPNRNEPQNQLNQNESQNQLNRNGSQNQLNHDALANTPASQLQANRDSQVNASSSTQPTDKLTTDLPIAKELIPLVQQQLHTLETHQLTWSGQVWPEQQMQWKIQGESEHHSKQPDERQWSTEMELALPKLGDVHARLVFSRGGIKLTLRGSDASSVALFNRQLPALAATLADAGIPLTGAVVEKT